jgi:predicted RNA-binding Zn-ribbon protein involved in translation (DUF1610 family)
VPEWKPLGWPNCPECRSDGNESIVTFRLTDGVIEKFRCDKCGYTDKPGAFVQ